MAPITDRSAAAAGAARDVGELLATVSDPEAPRDARLTAGRRLSSSDPRPGVLTLEPAWCTVAAGPFLMGSADDPAAFDRERPQHRVDLPAFRIARFPVTNGQWSRFVDDNGYGERGWWSEEGWAARQEHRWTAPRSGTTATWPGTAPNCPIVGVSWYEAQAYCAWLSHRLRDSVRLPSEAEWEKAARGTDGRIYTSGDTLDREAYHLFSTGTWRDEDAPAPVGCYPRGVSPCGAEDLLGNTYAWTTSRWGPSEDDPIFGYPYVAADGREAAGGSDFRIVRGGAWGFPPRHARCAYRGKDRPHEASLNVGVRVASNAE
jgi:formylglycine-generating enzyme required for sulfatase activity